MNVTTKRSLSKEHSPRSLGHHPVFSTNLDWPVADDGINAEWRPLDGILGVLGEEEASPVKKYATAFKLNYQRMKSSISKSNGIDSQTNAKVCSFDWQCEDSSCAIRRGHVSGRCVPRWYGICHAWAPASILEAEPKCPVVKNGVKFRVQGDFI